LLGFLLGFLIFVSIRSPDRIATEFDPVPEDCCPKTAARVMTRGDEMVARCVGRRSRGAPRPAPARNRNGDVHVRVPLGPTCGALIGRVILRGSVRRYANIATMYSHILRIS